MPIMVTEEKSKNLQNKACLPSLCCVLIWGTLKVILIFSPWTESQSEKVRKSPPRVPRTH